MVKAFDCDWCRGSLEGLKDSKTSKKDEELKKKERESHFKRRLEDYKPIKDGGHKYCSTKCMNASKKSENEIVWN